jgi:hypothetical protein
VSANSFSCLWPRAIIELCNANEPEATVALSKLIKRHFDQTVVSISPGIQIDVTHLQQSMGSPVDIANYVQQIVSDHGLSAPDIGIASERLIASYAARYPRRGKMQGGAPASGGGTHIPYRLQPFWPGAKNRAGRDPYRQRSGALA